MDTLIALARNGACVFKDVLPATSALQLPTFLHSYSFLEVAIAPLQFSAALINTSMGVLTLPGNAAAAIKGPAFGTISSLLISLAQLIIGPAFGILVLNSLHFDVVCGQW